MTSRRHRVVVLALDGVLPFELGIPPRIFGRATGPADDAPLYEVLTCGLRAGPVRTAEDYTIVVEHDADALATADTVVIPASYELGRAFDTGALDAPVAAALAVVRPGARLVSICTAAFLLAAAGMLDGRRATTHWFHAERFRTLFPHVDLQADVLFVDEGDVATSAGVAAGIDLCLHLVRRDHGAAVANVVARRCLVPPWRSGGQAQFVERPVPETGDAGTGPARDWALRHLDQAITLEVLARRANMSVRTFSRRFGEEVGVSPGRWLIAQRVELARRLLETTGLGVDAVAEASGFGTAASLRQHLHAEVGVSPLVYRRTFQVV